MHAPQKQEINQKKRDDHHATNLQKCVQKVVSPLYRQGSHLSSRLLLRAPATQTAPREAHDAQKSGLTPRSAAHRGKRETLTCGVSGDSDTCAQQTRKSQTGNPLCPLCWVNIWDRALAVPGWILARTRAERIRSRLKLERQNPCDQLKGARAASSPL